MKKRNAFGLPVLCAVLYAVMIPAACSAASRNEAFDASFYAEAPQSRASQEVQLEEERQEAGAGGRDEAETAIQQSTETLRKLVKRATLRIRAEDLAAADTAVTGLMEKYGAYSSSTEIEENSRTYVIRVPAAAYGSFLAEMGGMGRTLHRSESAEDVTLRYYDLESRLATRQELLKTFQSYLGKAKNIEEILSVEERIADLQSEIDRTGKDLRSLSNLVDYATIRLEVYGPVAAVSYRGPTLGERIKELFSGFGGFVSTVLVVLTGIVIYGIPVILILILLFWLLFGRIGLVKKLWRLATGAKIFAGAKVALGAKIPAGGKTGADKKAKRENTTS